MYPEPVDCDGGIIASFEAAGGGYRIVSSANQRVVDCSRNDQKNGRPIERGCNIQVWAADDPKAQIWKLVPVSDGYVKIVLSAHPSWCLTVSGKGNDANVYLDTYSGGDGQLWSLSKYSS
ncbi:RICIN domain-containing protein [Anaerolentibacter hominis]|uniref:RICIN domain-containing protein n=1 Tax=Anaerolentibacter hominis TaxID=3079009 RepID=UPI0031B87C8D